MSVLTQSRAVPRVRRSSLMRRRYIVSVLFVLPMVVNFLIFRYTPIGLALHASLHEYSLLRGLGAFTGLDQYTKAVHDDLFWQSMKVSTLFAVIKVPLQIALSLLLALFLAREVRGMGAMRTIVYVPVVTSIVVVAMLWSMMLNKDQGLIQSGLEAIGIPRTGFLSSRTLALPTLAIMMVWKEIGFSTIIFVAGLKGIPAMFYDAAAIDGANPVQQFFRITLPLLKPVTLFVIVTQTISSLQIFVPIFVMTHGGPFFATNGIVYYIYQNGFQYNDMGYASAMSFLVLVLLVVISTIQFRMLRSDVEY
jgi:ABC-type sugar transport system permease subunit